MGHQLNESVLLNKADINEIILAIRHQDEVDLQGLAFIS